MKGQGAAGPGARAFGENDKRLPVLQCLGRRVEHVHTAVVADVLRLSQRAAGEKVVPEALLDHAVGLAHQPDQKHHIDQRGVIGDDHLPWPAEFFRTADVIGQYPCAVHEADEQPEQLANRAPRPAPVSLDVTWQAAQQREKHQAQAQAAGPEQGKAHGGSQQAPIVGVMTFHWCLRCQCQVRPLQVCWQPACPVSRQRSRSTAWGHWHGKASAFAVSIERAQSSPAVNNRPTA
ncbi:hypothetical protein D3C76_486020 [compost metagenome]